MAEDYNWMVGVQQSIRLPHREKDDIIERTFNVRARTAKQAEKAVRDTGIRGAIQPAARTKYPYMLGESLEEAARRPTGNEPRKRAYGLIDWTGGLDKMAKRKIRQISPLDALYTSGDTKRPKQGDVITWEKADIQLGMPKKIYRQAKFGTPEADKLLDEANELYTKMQSVVASTQEVKLVSPAADLQWSEPKDKLEKIADEFRKYYGKKVTIYGGGGAPPSTAILQRVELHPTILRGKDGYTLKAYVKGADSKILPANRGGEWDFWLGSWQIAVNPGQAGRAKKPTETSLQSIHDSRSPRSRESDEHQSNADTIEPDDSRVERWLKDPGSSDIVGIDTPRKHKGKKVARKTRKSTRTETQVRGIRR